MRGQGGVRGQDGVGWRDGACRAASRRGRGGFAVMRGCGVVVVGDRDLSFDVVGFCHDGTAKRGDEIEDDSHGHRSGMLSYGKKRAGRDRGRVHIPQRDWAVHSRE